MPSMYRIKASRPIDEKDLKSQAFADGYTGLIFLFRNFCSMLLLNARSTYAECIF